MCFALIYIVVCKCKYKHWNQTETKTWYAQNSETNWQIRCVLGNRFAYSKFIRNSWSHFWSTEETCAEHDLVSQVYELHTNTSFAQICSTQFLWFKVISTIDIKQPRDHISIVLAHGENHDTGKCTAMKQSCEVCTRLTK